MVTVSVKAPYTAAAAAQPTLPGLVFQIIPSNAMCELAQRRLPKLDTLDPGNEDDWMLKRVGGGELAYTDEQMRELKRRHGFAQAWGVESELIGPSRTKDLWPSLDTS